MKLFRCVNLIIFLSCAVAAQDFKTVQGGVEYAQFTRQVKINDKETAPVVINALRLDLKKTRLDVVHAMDAAIGTEKTSSIATRHGAVAAVNGGFFRLDKSIFAGDATGILSIDNRAFSEPIHGRVALFLINRPNFEQIEIRHFNDTHKIKIKKIEFELSGLNRERGNDEIVKFTPDFHRTTLTNQDGVEVVVENKRIKYIFDGKGSSLIPRNGYVISANGKMREKVLQTAKIGLKVESYVGISVKMDGKDDLGFVYGIAEDIVGGVPQLIKNSKIEITWEREKSSKSFVETRHPRTAVAKLKDGKALLVTVDGRQPGVSAGMNLQELAEMLLEMGATDAMNLDGGGSTTMFLDGKVVNKPSDKEGERAVSNAILVSLRK